MATLDTVVNKNRRLFDMLFRHQVYLEGVKTNFTGDYRKMLTLLYGAFASFLARQRYQNLDQFTLGELNNFIRLFQLQQGHFYAQYTQQLISLLKEFVKVDSKVTHSIFAAVGAKRTRPSIFPGVDEPAKLYAEIVAEPVPANGLLVDDQIATFAVTAMNHFSALIRQGYANGWTAQELLTTLNGDRSTGTKGLFDRLTVGNSAMIAAIMQHLSSGVQAAIASAMFQKYQWVSILDSQTTLVCRSRNGVIYIYGDGPLPPAHWGCRSKPVPEMGEGYEVPKTYYEWLKVQPDSFQNDILGPVKAALLRSGNVVASDFETIRTITPLTLSQFVNKIKYILGE